MFGIGRIRNVYKEQHRIQYAMTENSYVPENVEKALKLVDESDFVDLQWFDNESGNFLVAGGVLKACAEGHAEGFAKFWTRGILARGGLNDLVILPLDGTEGLFWIVVKDNEKAISEELSARAFEILSAITDLEAVDRVEINGQGEHKKIKVYFYAGTKFEVLLDALTFVRHQFKVSEDRRVRVVKGPSNVADSRLKIWFKVSELLA